jgi:exodeoxyribonuclease-3
VKLATWNVNSVRMRLDRLVAFLGRERPDVCCLQELKVVEADFPRLELEALGYRCTVHGQKTYNGVAILSRDDPAHVQAGFGDGADDPEARFLTATVGGIRIACAYVPNGKTVGTEKWTYKLAWLGRLRGWLERTAAPDAPLALCGDFNVAPEDRDVARPEEWRDSVLTHADARAAFAAVTGWGLTDAVRLHHDGEGPFTWWDYRMLGFPKNNGLRIDHVLVTGPLAARCREARVDRNERKGKQPSDHAPVITSFD